MSNPEILKKYFKNKKILVTGHTGFKGAWLCQILLFFGARVMGISNSKVSKVNLYELLNLNKRIIDLNYDLSKKNNFEKKIKKFNPHFIFHLAAQSLVIKSYKDPYHTFQNNINSSLNLLESTKKLKNLKALIFVTSDKVYDVNKSDKPHTETDALGGNDAYSLSKACSEHIFKYYLNSIFKIKKIGAASVRAGNVIGGGDWSENRIIPDLMRSLNKKNFLLRKPKNIRPWQHVLDCLFGYIVLLIKLSKNPSKFSGSWNFGYSNKNITTRSLIKEFNKNLIHYKKINIINSKKQNFQETKFLKLNTNKTKKKLNYYNSLSVKDMVKFTTSWYLNYFNKNSNVSKFTNSQIEDYIRKSDLKI